MTEVLAEAIGLFKDYRRGLSRRVLAIDDVSVRVMRGSVTALIGPNGAGKTTTIHALLGFLKPKAGAVRLFGAAAVDPEALRRVGYLPEDFRPYAFETPVAALQHLGTLSGMTRAELRQRIPEVLARVGLAECSDRRAGTFSKGMAQRLGVAQALLHRPELLVLDEPMSGLDPEGRHDLIGLIMDERARGTTVILCTHVLSDVERLADSVYVYRRGRIVGYGTVPELIGDAAGLEAAYITLQRSVSSGA